MKEQIRYYVEQGSLEVSHHLTAGTQTPYAESMSEDIMAREEHPQEGDGESQKSIENLFDRPEGKDDQFNAQKAELLAQVNQEVLQYYVSFNQQIVEKHENLVDRDDLERSYRKWIQLGEKYKNDPAITKLAREARRHIFDKLGKKGIDTDDFLVHFVSAPEPEEKEEKKPQHLPESGMPFFAKQNAEETQWLAPDSDDFKSTLPTEMQGILDGIEQATDKPVKGGERMPGGHFEAKGGGSRKNKLAMMLGLNSQEALYGPNIPLPTYKYDDGTTYTYEDPSRPGEGTKVATQRELRQERIDQLQLNNLPMCLEDICLLIEDEQPDVFGENGMYHLFDKETGEVVQGHFLQWVRNRMLYWHNDAPDDTIDFAAKITLRRSNGDIQIGRLLEKPDTYFVSKPYKDIDSLIANEKDDERRKYDELFEQTKRELTYFGLWRRVDNELKDKEVAGSDTKGPAKMIGLFGTNFATKDTWNKLSGLGWMTRLPQNYNPKTSKHGQSLTAAEVDVESSKDTTVGEAASTAFYTYFQLRDFEELQKIYAYKSNGEKLENPALFDEKAIAEALSGLTGTDKITEAQKLGILYGKDGMFFNRKGFQDWLLEQHREKNGNRPMTAEEQTSFDEKVNENRTKYATILLKSHQKNPNTISMDEVRAKLEDYDNGISVMNRKQYIDFMNIFNRTGTNPTNELVLRNLVQQSIVQKHGLYINGDNNKPDKGNGEYADTFAFSMIRWSGAISLNDTNADARFFLTKGFHLRGYRRRQSRPSSGGSYGNPYSLDDRLALTVDPLTAMNTEQGHRPIDVIKDIVFFGDNAHKSELAREAEFGRNETAKETLTHRQRQMQLLTRRLTFLRDSMSDWGGQHLNQTMLTTFPQIVDAKDINLSKVIEHNQFGNVDVNMAAWAEEIKENRIKPRRYALSTFGHLDFTKMVRVEAGKDEWGANKYKEVPLVLYLFGRHVLDVPEFWKYDENGIPEMEIDDKGNLVHALDFKRMQNEKQTLAKVDVVQELIRLFQVHSIVDNPYGYDFWNYEMKEKLYLGMEKDSSRYFWGNIVDPKTGEFKVDELGEDVMVPNLHIHRIEERTHTTNADMLASEGWFTFFLDLLAATGETGAGIVTSSLSSH